MGEAEAPRVSSTFKMPAPGGAVRAVTTQAPSGAPGSVSTPMPGTQPTPQRPRPTDPLSRPFKLPSRGLYYGGGMPGGEVVISPTNGAQEEVLAATKENPATALQVLRHVMEQCIWTGSVPFNNLLLFDFSAMVFPFFAASAGTDELSFMPVHKPCKKPTPAIKKLSELACTSLRRAEPGEDIQWPPLPADDPMAVLKAMEEEEKGGDTELVLPEEAIPEPFITEPLPHTGDVIGWRYHRVSDQINAEEFSARTNGGGIHNFLMGCQLVSLNGRQFTGTLEATSWVKRQPSPILNAIRDDMSQRDIGYELSPKFTCKHCGGDFSIRLPMDGAIFRRRRRR